MKELGISHRDISPQNILIDCDGNYKLADIGAGKSLFNKNTIHILKTVIAKENYMSPEVRNGIDKIDWYKADAFSLGKVVQKAAVAPKITDDPNGIETAWQAIKDESIYSTKLVNCIENCLCDAFAERNTLEEIKLCLFA